jgi:DNA-binding NarL/FixJ family response regulator
VSEGPTAIIVGSRLLQEALAALLARQEGVTVLGTCAVEDAIAMASKWLPDVLLMELPHGRPTLSYLPGLMKLRPAPRTILVGRNVSPLEITAAVELGVDACVSEDDGYESILEALDTVRRSERYMAPTISDILRAKVPPATVDEREMAGVKLSQREYQVLSLIAHAKSEPQIASELGLSPKTVHAHRTSIMNKLHVHNGIALIRRAVRLGLVDLWRDDAS